MVRKVKNFLGWRSLANFWYLARISFGCDEEDVVKISDSWEAVARPTAFERYGVPRVRDRRDDVKIIALVKLTDSSSHRREHGGGG